MNDQAKTLVGVASVAVLGAFLTEWVPAFATLISFLALLLMWSIMRIGEIKKEPSCR